MHSRTPPNRGPLQGKERSRPRASLNRPGKATGDLSPFPPVKKLGLGQDLPSGAVWEVKGRILESAKRTGQARYVAPNSLTYVRGKPPVASAIDAVENYKLELQINLIVCVSFNFIINCVLNFHFKFKHLKK